MWDQSLHVNTRLSWVLTGHFTAVTRLVFQQKKSSVPQVFCMYHQGSCTRVSIGRLPRLLDSSEWRLHIVMFLRTAPSSYIGGTTLRPSIWVAIRSAMEHGGAFGFSFVGMISTYQSRMPGFVPHPYRVQKCSLTHISSEGVMIVSAVPPSQALYCAIAKLFFLDQYSSSSLSLYALRAR